MTLNRPDHYCKTLAITTSSVRAGHSVRSALRWGADLTRDPDEAVDYLLQTSGDKRGVEMATYVLSDLICDYGALEPAMSGEILELHHSKHHAAYVKGANDALDQLAEAADKASPTQTSAWRRRWRSTSPGTYCIRPSGRTCPRTAEADRMVRSARRSPSPSDLSSFSRLA